MYERSDWPLAKLQDYFKNDTLALIGYGSQGHGQGLNARDNGLNVIVGVRKDGESWKQAMQDGWVRIVVLHSSTLPIQHCKSGPWTEPLLHRRGYRKRHNHHEPPI